MSKPTDRVVAPVSVTVRKIGGRRVVPVQVTVRKLGGGRVVAPVTVRKLGGGWVEYQVASHPPSCPSPVNNLVIMVLDASR